MREYDYLTHRYPRTRNEAFGTSYIDLDEDNEYPHWFEIMLYVLKSMFAGLGLVTTIVLLSYWIAK